MKTLFKIFIKTTKWFLLLSVIAVLVFKWAPVRYTLQMAKSSLESWGDESYVKCQSWIPINRVSDSFNKAIIASKDANFYSHNGFLKDEIDNDFHNLKNRINRIPTCSTISQQASMNIFTFGSNSWLRRGVQTWYTFLIEKIWGKERILEVYINVAEFGNGIYGIQAASKHYLHKDASCLTLADSNLLISHLS